MKNLVNQLLDVEDKPFSTKLEKISKDLKPRHLLLVKIDRLHHKAIFRTECLNNSEMTLCRGEILLKNINFFLNRFLPEDRRKLIKEYYKFNHC